MKILIGITTKNRASILPKAIESALNQTCYHKEVWVFDDASEDDTFLLKNQFPEVKWFFSKDPKGLVWARNFFMKQEGFDYFCSLDDDAWFVRNDAILEAIEGFNEDIGVIGFEMLTPDEPNQKNEFIGFKESNNFIGCGHVINLKAAKQIGYYIENPGFYGVEEKDFCIRLIDAGYKIFTFKGMYIWHDKTMIARNLPKQHRSGVCNDLVFTYRRTPFIFLIPALGIKALKHLKFSTEYRKVSLTLPCIQGIVDFLKWLMKEKTNRKAVSMKAFKSFIRIRNN